MRTKEYRDIRMYSDMFDLPHHVSKTHPRMDLDERSAQFSPFRSLTGYEDAVEAAGEEHLQKELQEYK